MHGVNIKVIHEPAFLDGVYLVKGFRDVETDGATISQALWWMPLSNKNILMDCPISKLALLRQTFELSVAYSGKLLPLAKMLGVLQDAGNTVTLSSYLNLLGDSGLTFKQAIQDSKRWGSSSNLP